MRRGARRHPHPCARAPGDASAPPENASPAALAPLLLLRAELLQLLGRDAESLEAFAAALQVAEKADMPEVVLPAVEGMSLALRSMRDEARAELELVLAQPDTPPFLRARAEQKLNMLDKGTRGAVKREFVALVDRANEIPDEDLRHSLQDMLGAAQGAWENGESEQAIQILQQAQQWVQDNSDVLGAPLTGDLLERLPRIIDMAQATAGP